MRYNRRERPSACLVFSLLALCIGMLSTPAVHSQSAVEGSVVAEDGKPIGGVQVYGSLGKVCCPFKREQTVTDDDGHFRIGQPGSVLHFLKSGLEPAAIVVNDESRYVRVVLKQPRQQFILRRCGQIESSKKRLGWGKYGIHFDVPDRMKVRGGKADVDYVRYVIQPENGDGTWSSGSA